MQVAAGTIDKMVELVYNYHTRIKDCARPLQKCNDYRAISVFWNIGGIKAHCLLDSGCEGIVISLEFTKMEKIKTFVLKKPIGI